ncbi:MAG: DUF512 domain-containing protein [Blautia sp.]|nr:DUF512 domain-containing protein [Blautia sp.]MDY5031410.1 DUF512 domain-containing protein [Blautia sp.]
MKRKKHVISRILPGSIAEELELEPGDVLVSVNGQQVEDVFDYRYLMNEEYVELTVEKRNGELWELEVEKEFEEDLGMEFENGLMDDYRTCSNKCIFCFIDQMPPGMRKTLYFKDDDSRLSFLQGNYVTLTNMKDREIEKIIRYHLSPINISFQTMNPQLRCQMLNNRFAGEALKKVDRLYQAGIQMNGQIVLCKGINDGEELEYSLQVLSGYAPVLQSVSVVPVGLSRFRDGLYPLEPFEKEDAKELLRQVHRWQKQMYELHGMHFVHASDEWYILAGEALPGEDSYDGYLQLENGVGMLRLLESEVDAALSGRAGDDRRVRASIATGKLAAPYLQEHVRKIQEKYPNVQVRVQAIQNDFFGPSITVSGLITGADLYRQLSGTDLGDRLLLPCSMLRSGEEVFLDDMTVTELSEKLKTEIVIVDEEGEDLVEAILNPSGQHRYKRRQMYEQTGSSNCGETECREVYPV